MYLNSTQTTNDILTTFQTSNKIKNVNVKKLGEERERDRWGNMESFCYGNDDSHGGNGPDKPHAQVPPHILPQFYYQGYLNVFLIF